MSSKDDVSRRDPLKDPRPGDVVRQPSGHLIRVTNRHGDRVEWVSRTPKGSIWKDANGWTIRGWINVVCDRAVVVENAEMTETSPVGGWG